MRWSERRTAVRSTFEDDFHTSTPSDARSRPPSLILVSLDAFAAITRFNELIIEFCLDCLSKLQNHYYQCRPDGALPPLSAFCFGLQLRFYQ
jgi:hypothetical protein